jgi:ABC-type transporter lipoprotein component MlaA
MKPTRLPSILLLSSFFVFPFCIQAQDRDAMSRNEITKMDSVESATLQADQLQKSNDETRMAEAKLDKKQTRAKSKDAKRVEEEASSAARESKSAYRKEKKAQKSRKEAPKQNKKAADARAKSDKN